MTKSVSWISKSIIISTVIAGILLDFILKAGIISKFFNRLFGLFIDIYGFILKPTVVPNWLFIFLIIGWLIILIIIILRIYLTSPPPPPNFLNYTEDIFHGVLYRWEYYNNNGKYIFANPIAYCPQCKCKLVFGTCPIDNKFYNKLDSKILGSLIEHQISLRYPSQ